MTDHDDLPAESEARRFEIVVDSVTPARLARFWASALPGYAVRAYDAKEVARSGGARLDAGDRL
jgi:hypothetical protein